MELLIEVEASSFMSRKRKAEAVLGASARADMHVGVSALKQDKILDKMQMNAAAGEREPSSISNRTENKHGPTLKKGAVPLDKHAATSAATWDARSAGVGSPKVARVDSSSLTPQRLWDDVIVKRIPAVVSGYPQDASWKAGQLWTLNYLERLAVRFEIMPSLLRLKLAF